MHWMKPLVAPMIARCSGGAFAFENPAADPSLHHQKSKVTPLFDCHSHTGSAVGPGSLHAPYSSGVALHSRLLAIFPGRLPARRRFSSQLGRSSAAKPRVGFRCAGGMAPALCHPPFAGPRPLAFPRLDPSPLRCCFSRSSRQSFLLESLDHRHRRDVLLHLPPSL